MVQMEVVSFVKNNRHNHSDCSKGNQNTQIQNKDASLCIQSEGCNYISQGQCDCSSNDQDLFEFPLSEVFQFQTQVLDWDLAQVSEVAPNEEGNHKDIVVAEDFPDRVRLSTEVEHHMFKVNTH